MNTIWLSWQEQQNLYKYAESITKFDDVSLYEKLSEMREISTKIFDKDTIKELSSFIDSDINIIRVSGLPVDRQIPKTPYDGYIQNEEIPIASVVQMMMFALTNISPIAYSRENKGQLYRHVVPTKSLEFRASSHGSGCTLDMHVSNPILPIIPESTNGVSGSPEILSLYGVRQSSGVYTEVVELDDVLEILPDNIIESLQEENYYFRMPSSFGEGGLKGPFAVIARNSDGVFYNRTDMDTAIPINYKAMESLSIFLEATREVKHINKLLLAPGDMLLFKNQRTLHSRKKFTAQYNGLDRWMVRLYGTAQPHRHHSISIDKPYIGFTYSEGA